MKKNLFLLSLFFSLSFSSLAITKLNQPLAANGKVLEAVFASGLKRDYVVYQADVQGTGQLELFSVNTLTFAITNLSGVLVPGGGVSSFQLTPDGQFVIFLADKNIDETFELFSVPVQGGIPLKLHSDLINPNQDVSAFKIAADSQKVIYSANIDNISLPDFYATSLDQNNSINLTAGLFNLSSFEVTSNSSNIVFLAQEIPNPFFELFTVSLSGGKAVKLNPPFVLGQNVFDFKLYPNSNRVAYRAFQDDLAKLDIYQVDLEGSNLKQITEPAPNGGLVFSNYEIAPNESNLVYVTSQIQPGIFNLLSYSTSLGTLTNLNSVLPVDGGVNSFSISPDSQWAVYKADQILDEKYEIFSVPIIGGNVTPLNGPIQNQGSVISYQITANSERVIYRADANAPNLIELFSVPITGGAAVRLNPDLVNNGDVESFTINNSENKIFYLSDQLVNDRSELFSVPDNGSNAAIKVNADLIPGGNVINFNFNSAGTRLFYLADQEIDGKIELYTRVIAPPLITSATNSIATVGQPFNYIITAQNPPLLGFQVQNLPDWASLQNNVISGIPVVPLPVTLTLFVTNEAGFASTNLTLKINPKVFPPDTNSTNIATFTGDFDGDNSPDLLAQKSLSVTLIRLLSNGTFSADKTLELPSKKHKVVAANIIQGTNAIIVQNGTTLSALQVDSNFTVLANINLGSLPDNKTKVRASGDINNDGLADILTQKGKSIGALLSPGYSFFSLTTTPKPFPPIVALLPSQNATNTGKTLLLAKGKKLFTYDLLSALPFINPTNAQPVAGPVMNAKYTIAGSLPNIFNTNATQIILQKGKKAGVAPYGSTTLAEPTINTKLLGKIVGPK